MTQASMVNHQHYNLVDRCSLDGISASICYPALGGAPGYCEVYTAQIQMAPAAAGVVYRDRPLSRAENGMCPTMAMNRSQTRELWIQAVGVQPEIYAVVPELVVQSAQGSSTVSLPELAGTVAFADPSQFSCYKLADSSFVKVLDGADIFPSADPRTGLGATGAGKWPTRGVWCV